MAAKYKIDNAQGKQSYLYAPKLNNIGLKTIDWAENSDPSTNMLYHVGYIGIKKSLFLTELEKVFYMPALYSSYIPFCGTSTNRIFPFSPIKNFDRHTEPNNIVDTMI